MKRSFGQLCLVVPLAGFHRQMIQEKIRKYLELTVASIFCSLLQREMQEAIQTRNTALCQKVQKVSLHSDSTNRRHSM